MFRKSPLRGGFRPARNADSGAAFDALRLIRSRRVGPATFYRLLEEHGSTQAALAALPDIAQAAGIAGYAPCPLAAVQAELSAGRRAGARLLSCFDADYPQALRDIPEAPPVIWVKGDLTALNRPQIAVIGARNASSLGLRMARTLAGGLSRAGIVTVSGLARGIDTVAHEASLATGTIAVMAGGIDVIYPAENTELAARICETGLLLSEQPPGLAPLARHFPARNRIISALSLGVVVVEAAERSGSLITAQNALDQGREVLAVPGHPMDSRASGCNNLIRDGATLVRSAQDVLNALELADHPPPERGAALRPPVFEETAPAPHRSGSPAEEAGRQKSIRARILARLNLSPTDEDALLRDLGIPAAEGAQELLALELGGEVQRSGGGFIHRN